MVYLFFLTCLPEFKMTELQEINEKFLQSLLENLENCTRYYMDGILVLRYRKPFFTRYIGLPMYAAREKIKSFEQYFEELKIPFPDLKLYPGKLCYETRLICIKEEEYLFKNKKVFVKYNSVLPFAYE